jgi:NAD(P)H-dependent flavin oxidoreductase YrpB (nitropropane dioxygenase family)
MELPTLKIGDKIAKYPIIQGGMGVGVSRSKLAGAVAKEGCIGIISTAQIGFDEPDFESNTLEANLRSLEKHIKEAKRISNNGIIGINIMCVTNHYKEMIKKAIDSGIDLILSGAGLPKELPKLIENTKVKIAPIISSARGAVLMIKLWAQKYNYIPDLIVVEGPEAGGHLGFSKEELSEKKLNIFDIIKDVIEQINTFELKFNKKIPVIAAGGIYTGEDIAKCLKLGAAGVQMATRFVATEECDAHENFKKAYIDAKEENIKIIQSPVGMPGRAIVNKFIKCIEQAQLKPTKCLNCISTCNPAETLYCITKALTNSVKGDIDNGLVFCGSNAYRVNKIVSVKELINELVTEAELCYN